jgi:molybdopterin/thiamine biosynthesis adenylyltransferase
MTQSTQEEFYKEAFKRNKGLISDATQEKLQTTCIAIPGMGGVGGIHSETLARLGVGKFHVADGDTYELANFNRQIEAMHSTIGLAKEEVMSNTIKDINPFAEVKRFGLITSENIDAFLEGVDIVVDGMDFYEFDVRRLIFKKAYEKGIPVVTAGPVGFGSSVLVFTKESMTFDEYFNVDDTTPEGVKQLSFGIALTPSILQYSYFKPTTLNLKDHAAPSSVLGTLAAANWVGTLVYKIVDGKKVETVPVSFQFDPYVARMKRTHLYFGNRNIVQRLKLWYLKKKLID